jgi:hypothetical protein
MPVSTRNILVVARRTARSAGLEAALRARTEQGPTQFTLVVPLGRVPDARQIAADLAAELRAAGLDVTGHAANADPLVAVLELWNPAHYDEIIVSTLPAWKSRWMKSGLPQRIERQTGALVRHIEAPDHAEARSSHAAA